MKAPMSPVVSRIKTRIGAYRATTGGSVTQTAPEEVRDQQVSVRLHPFLLYRLEILARHAHMSRAQLMVEILQDGAEDILVALTADDPALRAEIDAEVVDRLNNKA